MTSFAAQLNLLNTNNLSASGQGHIQQVDCCNTTVYMRHRESRPRYSPQQLQPSSFSHFFQIAHRPPVRHLKKSTKKLWVAIAGDCTSSMCLGQD